jgi:hypothetical protein
MPQAQAYYPDGTPVPDDDLLPGLAEGRVGFQAGVPVKLRSVDGNDREVDGANVGAALRAGYSWIPREEVDEAERNAQYGTGAQTALAAGEGLLRGATVGLSDPALVALLGDDYRKDAAARRETAGPIATVSEVAGGVVPSLLSGGSGTVGTIARLTPAGRLAASGMAITNATSRALSAAPALVRGAAAGTAGGAFEGAIVGGTLAGSDAALGDKELTAEKLMAAGLEGALLGGATTGIVGAARAGLGPAGRKAVEHIERGGSLSSFAERQAVKQAVQKF